MGVGKWKKREEYSPSVLFNFSILALSGATRQIPPFVATRHLPPARGKSFLKGRALGMAGKFLAEVQSAPERRLPLPSSPTAMPPAPHSVANATSLPGRGESVQGDGFSGSGKLSSIAKRRPLGGAGERSETEGVKKHPRRLTPTGVSLCCYVPCTPKGTVTQA